QPGAQLARRDAARRPDHGAGRRACRARPGPPGRARHRPRHPGRDAGPAVRAVLHHPRRRGRDRAGARGGPRDRRRARRHDHRALRRRRRVRRELSGTLRPGALEVRMAEHAKILVIDDDAAVVELLIEELAPHYDAVGETSPRAGIERAVAGDFDIVISDVEMPELRGTALLTELLERKPGQLVLMITAFGSIELAVQAVRAGACDFVTKPFKIPALLLAVE